MERALYPTVSFVEGFHEIIIRQRGSPGWISKGMVTACLEWARTEVYNFAPFPTLLLRGAAILYSIIVFHPFVDGNKRTALMTTSFYFFVNGYSFRITDDAPEFTRDLAIRCSDPKHSTIDEVQRIAKWLKERVFRNRSTFLRFLHYLILRGVSNGNNPQIRFDSVEWRAYFLAWIDETTKRFRELGK